MFTPKDLTVLCGAGFRATYEILNKLAGKCATLILKVMEIVFSSQYLLKMYFISVICSALQETTNIHEEKMWNNTNR